jgi:hypothetical protein
MGNAEMPFVAVVGGLWQLDKERVSAARELAKAIGVELAKAGFGLVVYFSDEASLEPHVVSGYVAASAEDRGGEIRVRYAQSQRGKVRFNEEVTRSELFKHDLFPGQDWEAPFYRSLAEAEGVDAVLLLGGATSTLIAGQIAIARRLPILAVDEFGGSAAKIWNQLAQATPDQKTSSWGTRPVRDFVSQLATDCAAMAAKRKESRQREQAFATILAQRKKTTYAAVAFVLLLIALFFGMVFTPVPFIYPMVMFAGLVAAGATGALIRAVLWEPRESDATTSLVLGGVAGFVVGLAYLIPQWVGAPGVLSPSADVVTATDKIQFASAVLVAISAGVGFDTVFSRLQKDAAEKRIGPPTG